MSGERPYTATADPSRPSSARRIDHVGIATLDADAAATWYIDTLGMTIVGDEIVGSGSVRLMYLAPRDSDHSVATMVQLAEPVSAGNIRTFVQERGEGFHHLCFTVDSIDHVLEQADQSPDSIFLGGRERRACFLEHRPLDVLIELTETDPIASNAVAISGSAER